MPPSRKTKIPPGTIIRRKVAGVKEGGISHYRVVISEAMDCPRQTDRKAHLTVSLRSKKQAWRNVELSKDHWHADKSEVPKKNDISYIDYESIDLVYEEENGDIDVQFKVLKKSYVKPSGLDIIIDNLKVNINIKTRIKSKLMKKLVNDFLLSLNN